jgi:hypothetical protein
MTKNDQGNGKGEPQTLAEVAEEVGEEINDDPELSEEFERKLPVELTEAELLARAREWAEAEDELQRVAATLAAAKAEAKARTAELSERVTELQRQIRTGKERRDVVCYHRTDHRRGCVETIRMDTAEVVSTRALRPEERQSKLALHMGESPAEEQDAEESEQ